MWIIGKKDFSVSAKEIFPSRAFSDISHVLMKFVFTVYGKVRTFTKLFMETLIMHKVIFIVSECNSGNVRVDFLPGQMSS